MKDRRFESQLTFLLEADRLKEVLRQTLCTRTRRQENDAEHSWHLCLCVLVLAEYANAPHIDVLRVLRMVVLHDLVEIDAGDTFAYDAVAESGRRERECRAADRLFGLLPKDQAVEFRALWEEFEERKTPEAAFAAAIDRFQPAILNCSTQGAAWKHNGVTADRVLARNSQIADGAAALWERTRPLIAAAIARADLSSKG